MRLVTFSNGSCHSCFTCTTITRRGRKLTVYSVPGCLQHYRFKPEAYGFEIISADDAQQPAPTPPIAAA